MGIKADLLPPSTFWIMEPNQQDGCVISSEVGLWPEFKIKHALKLRSPILGFFPIQEVWVIFSQKIVIFENRKSDYSSSHKALNSLIQSHFKSLADYFSTLSPSYFPTSFSHWIIGTLGLFLDSYSSYWMNIPVDLPCFQTPDYEKRFACF
jgi:hypothetical protein